MPFEPGCLRTQLTMKFQEKAGFAQPRFTDQEDNLAMAFLHLSKVIGEEVQFPFPTDKGFPISSEKFLALGDASRLT